MNEANDALAGAGIVVALGGHPATLSITEANDALTSVGLVMGFIGSLNVFEDSDSLSAFGSAPQGATLSAVKDDDAVKSKTMLGVNQWLPVPPPRGVWVEIEGCT